MREIDREKPVNQMDAEGREGRRVTLAGFWVNLALVAAKFTCGVLGRSQALVADTVHSLSDLVTDVVVLAGLAAGRREPDEHHHFGHGRLETLAAAFVSLTLAAVGIYLGLESVRRMIHHNWCQPNWLALAAAFLSIAAKEGLYRYTVAVGRRIRSKAVLANAWHHRSDAWSSVAVFFGVAGATIHPEWAVLDAIAALIVSLIILKVGISMFLSAVAEFVDTAPDAETLRRIESCVQGVPGVRGLHDLKVRASADRFQMQVHIVVDGNLTVFEGHRVAKEVEACLFRDVGDLQEVIIHVDPHGESPD